MNLTGFRIFALATLLAFLAPLLHAQVLQEPRSTPGGGSQQGSSQSGESRAGARPLLGGDLPVIDTGSEIAVWDGQAWNLNETRLNAQFNAYLASPAADSEEDLEYHATMRRILDLLSPTNRSDANYREAISLLPMASSFPQDGDQSNTLLNAVYRVFLAQRRQGDISRMIDDMRTRQGELQWRGDLRAQERDPNARRRRPGSGDGENEGASDQTGTGTRSLAYEAITREILENEAAIKANQAAIQVGDIRARTEFQLLLAQMFLQRRFEHVLIGCAFYLHLFTDGEGTLRIEEGSDIGRLFSEGFGGSPTVSSLEAAARDAINRADSNVRAFTYHAASDELWSAYQRLQEAFAIGEYLPSVRTVPTEDKRRLIDFSRAMFRLTNAIQVKDYALAQELVDQLRETAHDFDSSKHQQAISVYTTTSDMHLGRAAILQSEGRIEEAQDEIRIAMEIWPTNPAIREQVAPSMEQLTMKGRLTQDFDRLVSERNLRAIFRDKEQYAAALFDDEERRDQLNQIVGDLIKIDTAIAQSRELEARNIPGAVYTAWEEIQTLVSEFGDDTELRIRAEELSTRASDFVSALDRAEQFQRSGNTGSALTWLMRAREIYPDSKRARDGIANALDTVLPRDGAFGEESTVGVNRPGEDPFR